MSTKNESIGSCIIVGGGPAGIQVARSIVKNSKGVDVVNVTIVDRQDYMDWSLASPRMLIRPDDCEKFGYVMPTAKVCEHIAGGRNGNVTFVQSAVSKIGKDHVELVGGKVLKADTIVIAVGGQYASNAPWKPLEDQTTKETRIAGLRTLRDKLSKSKSVLITGAGPTGVEVAGEVKSEFPNHKVTLIGTLLPNSPTSLQTRMKAALEGMGVVVREGRVDASEPDSQGNVTTRSGEVIENVDLILNAAGFTYKGKQLAGDSIRSDLTERGQFSCRPTLQLASTDTVFACGDILAVPDGRFADVKGLQHADDTGEIVGKNVVLLLKKKPLVEFKWSTKPVNKPMMTALGPKVAVGFLGLPRFLENFIGRSVKCKDYYMSLKGSSYGKGKTW